MTRISPHQALCILGPLVLPVLLLQTPASDAILTYMFHKVFVSPTMVSSSKSETLSDTETVHHDVLCSHACTLYQWCQLWCRTSSFICTFYSALVMPTYIDAFPDDALPCYTRRPRDLATGAKAITGTTYPNANVSILVDGIYDMTRQSCFKTKKARTYQWFLLDLGMKRTFSHVRLRAQPNPYANIMFSDLKVYISDDESKRFYGEFIGPAYENQEVDLTSPSPVHARYIDVQRNYSGQHFQVCHVEVF